MNELRENLNFYKKSEKSFRKLAETDLIGVCFGHTKGIITYANDEMLRMMGYTRNDFANGRIIWTDCIAPEYRNEFSKWAEKMMRDGIVPAIEMMFLRPDGGRTPFLGTAALVDPDDYFFVSIAMDLSRVLAAETKLWKNEQRYRIALSAMNLGVFEWQAPTDTMIWENPRMYEIFGRDPKEGPFTWEYFYTHVIDPEDSNRFKQALEEAMYPDRVFHTTCRIRRQSDGEKRWVAFSGKSQMGEDGTLQGLTGITSDITERKEIEEDRKRLNENLEKQVANKTAELTLQTDRLRALANQLSKTEQQERKRLANTLHDNIQPLIVSARMHLWEVKRRNSSDMASTKIMEKVDHILEESLASLRSLTMDLGPPELKNNSFDGALNRLVTKMRNGYNLTVNLYADVDIYPDSEETAGLVFNCVKELLFNVVKHAHTSEADVALSGTPGYMMKVVVSDRGKGFNQRLLKRMSPENMAFGLFSIQERLAYIGGEMLVETAPDSGTKVTISVPAAEIRNPKSKQPAKETSGNTMRITGQGDLVEILIVDDHKVLREGLKGMLQLEPKIHIAGEASNGPEAIEKTDSLRPDVVIMDVNLGAEMDGVAATREILCRHPGIKVIGLSMYDDENISAAMKKAGAAAYLPKSGPSDKLVETIRNVFD